MAISLPELPPVPRLHDEEDFGTEEEEDQGIDLSVQTLREPLPVPLPESEIALLEQAVHRWRRLAILTMAGLFGVATPGLIIDKLLLQPYMDEFHRACPPDLRSIISGVQWRLAELTPEHLQSHYEAVRLSSMAGEDPLPPMNFAALGFDPKDFANFAQTGYAFCPHETPWYQFLERFKLAPSGSSDQTSISIFPDVFHSFPCRDGKGGVRTVAHETFHVVMDHDHPFKGKSHLAHDDPAYLFGIAVQDYCEVHWATTP